MKEAAAERFWRCAAPLKIPALGCQQDEVVCMPVRIRLRCRNTPARRECLAHGLKFNSLINRQPQTYQHTTFKHKFFTQHILKQHSHFPGDVVVPNATVEPTSTPRPTTSLPSGTLTRSRKIYQSMVKKCSHSHRGIRSQRKKYLRKREAEIANVQICACQVLH